MASFPDTCGHDHTGSVTTFTAGLTRIARTMAPACAIATDPIATSDSINHPFGVRSINSPLTSHSHTLALPLRI